MIRMAEAGEKTTSFADAFQQLFSASDGRLFAHSSVRVFIGAGHAHYPHVDATDATRKSLHARMQFAAKPGLLTLLYPRSQRSHNRSRRFEDGRGGQAP
jgi:hypothetical protein